MLNACKHQCGFNGQIASLSMVVYTNYFLLLLLHDYENRRGLNVFLHVWKLYVSAVDGYEFHFLIIYMKTSM